MWPLVGLIALLAAFTASHVRASLPGPADPAPRAAATALLPDAFQAGWLGEETWPSPAPQLAAGALFGPGATHAAPSVRNAPQRSPAPKTIALVREASRWVGAGPRQLGLHRWTLWCAAGVNKFLTNIGLRGTGSDLAISFRKWGKPSKPVPGAVAIKSRRGGSGHVVVVKKLLPGGRLLAVSPNGGRGKVRLTMYRVAQFHTFRVPQ